MFICTHAALSPVSDAALCSREPALVLSVEFSIGKNPLDHGSFSARRILFVERRIVNL